FNVSKFQDPSGSSVTSRIFFDFRDLRRDGFLLSLTVLPSLHHRLHRHRILIPDLLPLLSGLFYCLVSETLLKWSEPAEHEFLRTYLGCLFVVSIDDENPIEELSKLIDIQHQQQSICSSSSSFEKILYRHGATAYRYV
ncbi:unnamed protein product, partial [Onchocerca flexuosa]|uniref:UDENN domain-containing protein n=1 Tax=Onchocerca flexuosa TaxID=387005 RepID=A0A183I8L0_9BILA